LPVFRALSGAVVVGSLSGKGKVSWWKAFNDTPEELASMSTSDHLSDKACKAAEQFAHCTF